MSISCFYYHVRLLMLLQLSLEHVVPTTPTTPATPTAHFWILVHNNRAFKQSLRLPQSSNSSISWSMWGDEKEHLDD